MIISENKRKDHADGHAYYICRFWQDNNVEREY